MTDKHTEKVVKSILLTVECGVPQGTILMPLLVILYFNDFPDHVKQKLLRFVKDSIVNNALSDTVKWLQLNNLVVNLDKTKLMPFYWPQSRPYNFTVDYDGAMLLRAVTFFF